MEVVGAGQESGTRQDLEQSPGRAVLQFNNIPLQETAGALLTADDAGWIAMVWYFSSCGTSPRCMGTSITNLISNTSAFISACFLPAPTTKEKPVGIVSFLRGL